MEEEKEKKKLKNLPNSSDLSAAIQQGIGTRGGWLWGAGEGRGSLPNGTDRNGSELSKLQGLPFSWLPFQGERDLLLSQNLKDLLFQRQLPSVAPISPSPEFSKPKSSGDEPQALHHSRCHPYYYLLFVFLI